MKQRSTLEGLPVYNAKCPLVISIEPRDVTASGKKDPGKCAAALAVAREYHTEARVHLSRLYVKDKNGKGWTRYETPPSLRTEIVSFDRGAGFQCGEYVAPPLRPSAQREGQQGSKNQHVKTGKTRRPAHQLDNVRIAAPIERHGDNA